MTFQFAEHFGLSLRLPQVVVNEVVDCADLLLDFLQPFGVGGKGVFQFIIFLDGLNDVGFEILISVDFLGEEVASCDVSLQVVVDHPSFRMKI